MKKSKLRAFILSAIIAGSAAFAVSSAAAAVQINPIQGLSNDFIMGADISMLPEIERLGGKFYDNGKEEDCLKILKAHGVNWIRVRIWNNPYVNGPEGVGGGNTDEAKALSMAARAKAMGMKVLVDFHYSDWWADPGKQTKPEAWKNDNAQQLAKDVYKYTFKVIKDFNDKGLTPDMVQIGNEVKSGMLWPEGKLPSKDGDADFSNMIRQGLKAVRDNDPQHKIKLMVHLPDGGDNAFYRNFFDSLIIKNKVNDFDIIGLSYYPFWHGTMDAVENNMNDISVRYNKDVIIVETAFGYTNENFDKQKNVYGPNEERIGGYRSTVQGQATGLHDVIERVVKVNNKRGLGIFYWEPDWIPTPGAGWKTGEGDEWDNLTLFDNKGNALDSIDTFNLVKEMQNKTIEPKAVFAETIQVTGGVGANVTLPQNVTVAYSDDSTKELPIVWDDAAPLYNTAGTYEVTGKIAAMAAPVKAEINVINKVNLVKNGNFETGTLDGWSINGAQASVVNIEKTAGNVRDKSAMHYWSDKAFAFNASQSFTSLKDGKYTVSCWTQGGGGESSYQLFIDGYGGEKQVVDIKDDGWNKWHQYVIKDVEIKNGQATIGVDMKGAAGDWGSVDDVEFYLQEE